MFFNDAGAVLQSPNMFFDEKLSLTPSQEFLCDHKLLNTTSALCATISVTLSNDSLHRLYPAKTHKYVTKSMHGGKVAVMKYCDDGNATEANDMDVMEGGGNMQ